MSARYCGVELLTLTFYWGILLFVATLIVRSAFAYRDLIQNLIDFEG